MATPIKIYELKGEDFAKGYSHYTDFAFAGLFREQANFDPFLDYGYFTPSLGGTTTDDTKTSNIKFINSFGDSGTAKLYAHTDDKLYEVLDGTPYTTTDKSAEINVVGPVTGAIMFKNRYIYAQSAVTKVFSNTRPVASASNIEIFDSGGSTTEYFTPMCVAPDKNLYFGHGDICRITTVSGGGEKTANNGTFYNLESGMYTRDLVSDGTYLIAIADNNTTHTKTTAGQTGSYRCQVLFYDVNSGRSTADYIYDFTDSYVSSVKVLDGAVYIFGKDNLWVCNSQTAPKAIFNFQTGSTITEPPQYFFQVHQRNNVIYWCGQTNQKIYAFGSKIAGQKKVFFQPFSNSSQPTCILTSGDNVYVGSNGNNQMLRVFNASQTKQDASLSTGYLPLSQPFNFAFAKVVMKNKLASGGIVGLGIDSLAGEITNYTTQVFSTIGAKQSIIFNKEVDTGNPPISNFNEFSLTLLANQPVSKVEIWAYPIDNYDQTV